MSRKPIDQVIKGRAGTPRERVWKFIRGRKDNFTVPEAGRGAKVNNDIARTYLNSLVKAGYVIINYQPQEVERLYRFYKGPMTAPRVRRNGSPVTQGTGQENMWRSMKMLKGFSVSELVLASNSDEVTVSASTAMTYITMLTKAGYLKKIGEEPARWILLSTKRTGPLAPMIQRVKHVFDPNINKVVWPLLSTGEHPPRRGRPPSCNDARRPVGLSSPKKGSEQGEPS